MSRSVITLLLAFGLVAAPASADFAMRGLIDAVVTTDGEAGREINFVRTGVSAFDPLHTRLFFEGGSERTRAFVQVLFRDTSAYPIRLFGAYVVHQPFESEQLFAQIGKIPTPEGSWGPRTYADQNPLIGSPLAYTWQTTLSSSAIPVDIDDLVARKGQATSAPAYTDGGGTLRGVAGPQTVLLYDNCWNDGVAVLGTRSGIEYQVAVTLGTSGTPINGVDTNDDLALHARLGWSPVPEVVVRGSWTRGAYMHRGAEPYLPAGNTANDYDQELWMLSLELSRGYFVFHGEFVAGRFDSPVRADGLGVNSGYAELQYKFAVGWTAAMRYDTIRFEEVETSSGTTAWDQDLDRVEAGISFDVSRDLIVKGVVQTNSFADEGALEDRTFTALQTVFRF